MIRKTKWQRCPYCGTNITRTESEKFDGMCRPGAWLAKTPACGSWRNTTRVYWPSCASRAIDCSNQPAQTSALTLTANCCLA